jgi:hypothetical protein
MDRYVVHLGTKQQSEYGTSFHFVLITYLNPQCISPTSASKPSKPSPLGVHIPLTSIDSTDSLVEVGYNYPNWSSWPSWITEAMQELDSMSDRLEWKECVAAWLEMEHRLGYPVGMVIISNILFLKPHLIRHPYRKKNINSTKTGAWT